MPAIIKHWSFSRAAALEECPRRYLLHYVVPRAPSDLVPESVQRNVLFLRQLKTLPMLLGTAVHQAASRWLESCAQGKPLTLKSLLDESWHFIERSVAFSAAEHYLYRDEQAPYYTVLMEHIYRIEITDAYMGRLYRKLKAALRRLPAWPVQPVAGGMQGPRLVQSEVLSAVERDGLALWFKLDALFQLESGQLLVVDWKLSEYNPQRDLLQLALYGTYVAEQVAGPGREVVLANYYLSNGKLVRHRFTSKLAAAVAGYVARSVQQMARLEETFFSGKGLAAQPPEWKAGLCTRCAFRKLCFPASGKPAVNPDC